MTANELPTWNSKLPGCAGCTHPREWHEDSGSGAPLGRCLYGCGCEAFNRRRRTKGTTISVGFAPEQARGSATFAIGASEQPPDALERAARELVTAATRLVEVLVAQRTRPTTTNGVLQYVPPKPPADRVSKKKVRDDVERLFGPEKPLGPGPEKILAAIVQHAGVRRDVLSVYVGFTRSTRDSYIRKLVGRGLIVCDADGAFRATDAGAALADVDPLPTGEDLRGWWLENLKPGPSTVFQLLCVEYPTPLTRDAISDRTGYTRSTRDSYLRILEKQKLVRALPASRIIASAHLFEKGAADHG